MPIIIKTIDEIVRARGRDTYWLRFAASLFADRGALRHAKKDHFAWFADQSLAFEIAAPMDWLEGNPGCFAIYFDDANDPRLQAYSVTFERPDGRSLQPGLYQMFMVPFRAAENE